MASRSEQAVRVQAMVRKTAVHLDQNAKIFDEWIRATEAAGFAIAPECRQTLRRCCDAMTSTANRMMKEAEGLEPFTIEHSPDEYADFE